MLHCSINRASGLRTGARPGASLARIGNRRRTKTGRRACAGQTRHPRRGYDMTAAMLSCAMLSCAAPA